MKKAMKDLKEFCEKNKDKMITAVKIIGISNCALCLYFLGYNHGSKEATNRIIDSIFKGIAEIGKEAKQI